MQFLFDSDQNCVPKNSWAKVRFVAELSRYINTAFLLSFFSVKKLFFLKGETRSVDAFLCVEEAETYQKHSCGIFLF